MYDSNGLEVEFVRASGHTQALGAGPAAAERRLGKSSLHELAAGRLKFTGRALCEQVSGSVRFEDDDGNSLTVDRFESARLSVPSEP
jgi:hypothetical protein